VSSGTLNLAQPTTSNNTGVWSLTKLASLYTVRLSAVNGLSRLTTTSNGYARPIRKFSNRPMTFESNRISKLRRSLSLAKVTAACEMCPVWQQRTWRCRRYLYLYTICVVSARPLHGGLLTRPRGHRRYCSTAWPARRATDLPLLLLLLLLINYQTCSQLKSRPTQPVAADSKRAGCVL